MPTSVTILQIHGHFTQELPRLLRRHAPEGEVWERNAICLSIDEQTGCAFSSSQRLVPQDLSALGDVLLLDPRNL